MSVTGLSDAEMDFFGELEKAAIDLCDFSRTIEASNTDPRAVSLMLYNRLTSNYRGFSLLWKNGRLVEAAIILRAALECTICLAANHAMRKDFYPLLLGDLVASLKGQIKLWRDHGMGKLVRDGEANLRAAMARAPEKSHAFDWQKLAAVGNQPKLYQYHRGLSATASHVTALSLLRDVVGIDGAGINLQKNWRDIERPKHIRQMAIAAVIGMKLHAELIESEKFFEIAKGLEGRLTVLSGGWSGD